MPKAESIRVRVVYALAERQSVVELVVPAPTTVAQAVEKSGLIRRFPEIGSQPLHCAIFGRVVSPSDSLLEGDRVEILRPLLADPKESRRHAAARSRNSPSRDASRKTR
jgi:putative ubiquitin-RnfH superfamily antitoxin RatB of RatAB toxin-antitoxin module